MSSDATPEAVPICSIGIPTFNRPDLLAATIDDARAQTYSNLEIIISDNASTDPRVEEICRNAAAADSRIRYIRQASNIGPMPNFEAALQAATGHYFCWFADDDKHPSTFIEKLVGGFSKTVRPTALVCVEGQYESPEGSFPFFCEGIRFYDGIAGSDCDRMEAVLRYAPGNFIYGVYIRSQLFHNGVPLIRWIGRSLNELPFFVLLAAKGDIVCQSAIGFTKRAPLRVCRTAKWEQEGGISSIGPQINVPAVVNYHRTVLQEVRDAIKALELRPADQARVEAAAKSSLASHCFAFCVGWKPRRHSAAIPRSSDLA